MPGLLFQITSVSFFVFIAFNSISWLKLWEDKEFKWKRVFIHLGETDLGRNILFGNLSLLKWLVILGYAATIFSSNLDYYYHLAVFALYAWQLGRILLRIYEKEFSFPSLLPSFIILFLTLALISVLFVFPPLDRFLWILILDKILSLIIGFLVLVMSIFFDFNQDVIINKALKKIKEHHNLLVIAVVGSYGKGTTKEFISRILGAKFNVLKTTTFNTPVGIARTIIRDLTPKKKIFIAEMEDYRFGDIEDMCNITIPKIAVVTGINDQNISMFANMNRLLDSKFQVIESLPRDGIGLFNGNSPESLALYEKTKNKKFVYASDESKFKSPSIRAFKIKENRFSISFNIEVLGKTYKISNVKLLGRANVENLLPAIFIGVYIGMDFSQIRRIIAELKPLPGTMDPRATPSGAVIIDDTYNANLNSVVRALDYLKIYHGKKVFVMEPFTGLGQNAKQNHADLGEKIAKTCDFLFLTNNNYLSQILKGGRQTRHKCIIKVTSPSKIVSFIRKEIKKQDVIIFEGKGARASMLETPSEPVYPS